MATFGTTTDLANWLTTGYFQWRGDWGVAHFFTNNPSTFAQLTPTHNPITVNLTGLTPDEHALAVSALAAWRDVCNISFTYTNGPAQITYVDSGHGVAKVTDSYSTHVDDSGAWGYKSSCTIDISSDFAGGWPSLRGPMYTTYLRETGEALGLGLLGQYKDMDPSVTFGVNNVFTNDSLQMSVMSDFPQSFVGAGTDAHVVTPQMADIAAIQSIYGAKPATHTNDVYGFHSTAGPVYDFGNYAVAPAFTIFDSGRDDNDKLDCSGYSQNQVIDLNPGHFSSVGGQVNNIGIYLTTQIESAVGGTGNDLIIANNSLSGILDGTLTTLTGGGGDDTFQGTMSGLGRYTITDMNVDDTINFTDAAVGSFYHTEIGTILSYGNNGVTSTLSNSLMLSNNPIGHLIEVAGSPADPFSGPSVELKLAANDPHLNDFNGDGRSDLLFRYEGPTRIGLGGTPLSVHDDVSIVEMNGGSVIRHVDLGVVGDEWHLLTTGDFDGNHASDIMWRFDGNGAVGLWEMGGTTPSTGAVHDPAGNPVVLDSHWQLAETGDFNGDGKNDILWRLDSNGALGMWEMDGFTAVYRGAIHDQMGHSLALDNTWHSEGTGDFNGDGKSDILWRNDGGATSVMFMNGDAMLGQPAYLGVIPRAIHVAGVADFDGDGKSDILWQLDSGATGLWLMDGGSRKGNVIDLGVVPSHVVGTPDFNDDGKADILWRDDAGNTNIWQMDGGHMVAQQHLTQYLPSQWEIHA